MLTEDQLILLRNSLQIIGVEYELEMGSQGLRDDFPNGIPPEKAIQFVKEVNNGKQFLENSALQMLAMVPVDGIAKELKTRLSIEKQKPATEESYHTILSLAESLMYVADPLGQKEFDALKSLCENFSKEESPVPMHWFDEIERKLAKWKRDRAAGKRWEIYEDDED
jgi:hypothetical protein